MYVMRRNQRETKEHKKGIYRFKLMAHIINNIRLKREKQKKDTYEIIL